MRITLIFFIVVFGMSLYCCQNSNNHHIKYDDIDSICVDFWRWDNGHKYHIVLEKRKGYLIRSIINGITDSVIVPVELPSDDVDRINEYVTKVYINNNTPPHVKKKRERLWYGMPKRMVTVIWERGYCISDTFHLPTIRDYEYELSDDFQKLYYNIMSITNHEKEVIDTLLSHSSK